jgi:hypothetical protein
MVNYLHNIGGMSSGDPGTGAILPPLEVVIMFYFYPRPFEGPAISAYWMFRACRRVDTSAMQILLRDVLAWGVIRGSSRTIRRIFS